MISLKNGVNPAGLRPELLLGIVIAHEVYKTFGHDLVLTSLNDSEHSRTSLHYDGKAVDMRTNVIYESELEVIAKQIRLCLGDCQDYDFVVESDHFHLEYQPKKPE